MFKKIAPRLMAGGMVGRRGLYRTFAETTSKKFYAKVNPTSENAAKPSAADGLNTGVTFKDLGLNDHMIENLKQRNIHFPFPVQTAVFSKILERKNLIVKEKTGRGKTLSYLIPLVQVLTQQPGSKILIMMPTRELVLQADKQLELLDPQRKVKSALVYGGADARQQVAQLRHASVIIATPGRLIDFMNTGQIDLSNLITVVFDETDQMLSFGFKEDLSLINKTVREKNNQQPPQFLMFSATVPDWVKKTAEEFASKFEIVNLIKDSDMKTPEGVSHYKMPALSKEKMVASIPFLIRKFAGDKGRSIIFTNTKLEADKLFHGEETDTTTGVLHGDISQSKREETFEKFRSGEIQCLVATNVAARGLDFPHVDVIIQLHPPDDTESYIHRSGRTARAGNRGVTITMYKPSETEALSSIESIAKIKFQELLPPTEAELEMEELSLTFANLSKIQVSSSEASRYENAIKKYAPDTPPEVLVQKLLSLHLNDFRNSDQDDQAVSVHFKVPGAVCYVIAHRDPNTQVNSPNDLLKHAQQEFSKESPFEKFQFTHLRVIAKRNGIACNLDRSKAREFEAWFENSPCRGKYFIEKPTSRPETIRESRFGQGSRGNQWGDQRSSRFSYDRSDNRSERRSDNWGEKRSDNWGEKRSQNWGDKKSDIWGEKKSDNWGEKKSENWAAKPRFIPSQGRERFPRTPRGGSYEGGQSFN